MKRIYSTPNIEGIYVLNYHEAQARDRENELKEAALAAEAAMEDARKEGYRQGHKDASKEAAKKIEAAKQESHLEGTQDGHRQAEEELSTTFKALHTATKELEQEKDQVWKKSEIEIIKLILAITQKVVGYEIDNNNHLIEKVVAEAILHAGKQRVVSVHLNPDDVAKLKNAKTTTDPDKTYEILTDEKISPGGCIVETDLGCIDAKLETRMNNVIDKILTHQESDDQASGGGKEEEEEEEEALSPNNEPDPET